MSEDLYLKMVLALPEKFFEGWQWQAGDRAISMNSFRELIIISSREEHQNILPGRFDAIFFGTRSTQEVNRNYLLPLPSQKQLMRIHHEKSGTANESHSMLFFANWLENKVKKDHGFCLKYRTAEELMLLWLMETCFEKTWNGEKWV